MYYRLKNLVGKSEAEITTAFAGIPPGTTILDLSENFFGAEGVSSLPFIFPLIPPSVTVLILDNNYLGMKTGSEMAAFLRALPLPIRRLSLNKNGFGDKTGAELIEIFSAVPEGVIELYLKDNMFLKKSGSELFLACKALHEELNFLDLSWNYISNPSLLFSRMNAITHLDMSGNNLGTLSISLKEFASPNPSKLSSLHFRSNYLDRQLGWQLAAIFKNLSQELIQLDISNNQLHNKSTEELALSFASIPLSVNELTLSLTDIQERRKAELKTLGKALPNVLKIIAVDDKGTPVQDPVVDEINRHIGGGLKATHLTMVSKKIPTPLITHILSFINHTTKADIASFYLAQRNLFLLNQRCENLISIIKQRLGAVDWNSKGGYRCKFFSIEKSPAGIEDLKKVVTDEKAICQKQLDAIEKIAKTRHENPPRFGIRDEEVEKLYSDFAQINHCKME